MDTFIHVEHASEVWSSDPKTPGPTGRFVEVLEGELQDYGGNVLVSGSAGFVHLRQSHLHGPTRLVPTKTKKHDCEISGRFLWQLVIE